MSFEEINLMNNPMYIERILPMVPSIKANRELLVPTSTLGNVSKYFEFDRFNLVQSSVLKKVYNSNENVLISAPTGSGKTEIALLGILRAIQRNERIIYIAPMKALAHEIFMKFKKILSHITIIEYTGDTEIDMITASKTQLIICTPEKFDVSTRKLCSIFDGIGLVVIDEIHLLKEDRGAVLENIVARISRNIEIYQRPVRIIGLSATFPNYRDAAEFIKAKEVFYFNSMYRPDPLKMTIVGFKKESINQDQNDYILEKYQYFKSINKQILIFVHSKSKTLSIAMMLMNSNSRKVENQDLTLKRKSKGFNSTKYMLVMSKIGIHHAGLAKNDRIRIEDLFRNKELDVIVCTATLAWGVNLPAHAVIINGTTIYDTNRGNFKDLGVLDILQIFGRAGRPQYDTEGHAFLLTSTSKMDNYTVPLKRNKEIESKLLHHVTDSICAEIYLSNITCISDALNWLKNTFLYTRIKRSPAIYGINYEDLGLEEQALSEYIYLSIKRLEDYKIIYIIKRDNNYNTWEFESNFFTRIASNYYLSHITIYKWISQLHTISNELSLLEILLNSHEFANITVRNDELTTKQTY